MTLSERAMLHAENMATEGWYTTANVLAECAEALEGGDAEAWHHCVEVMMTMVGLSCALSPAESMVEFQDWLSRRCASRFDGASRDPAHGYPVSPEGESHAPVPSPKLSVVNYRLRQKEQRK